MTLLEEVFEQPETLSRLIGDSHAAISEIADRISKYAPSSIVIAARGTSDNAARYAQYVWGARNRINVALTAPSLFSLYDAPPRLESTLVVGISQSGESPDLVTVLEKSRSQGQLTLAITNRPDSPLALVADLCLELRTGVEHAVAATKTYTAQLISVALLSAALNRETAALDTVVQDVESVLKGSEEIAAAASLFSGARGAAVLGRGFNHSTAFEWALKLQELAYVLAQPFSAADFVHGPLALVSEGFPVFAVAPSGAPYAITHALLDKLSNELGSQLAVISNRPETLALSDAPIRIPEGPEWLTPIVSAVAAQLFTYHLALASGLDPDSPRTINKITRTT